MYKEPETLAEACLEYIKSTRMVMVKGVLRCRSCRVHSHDLHKEDCKNNNLVKELELAIERGV